MPADLKPDCIVDGFSINRDLRFIGESLVFKRQKAGIQRGLPGLGHRFVNLFRRIPIGPGPSMTDDYPISPPG